jgi:hypothetical protein
MVVHCIPAGWVVPGEFSVKLSVTVPPGIEVAEESDSVCCPHAQPHMASSTTAARTGARNARFWQKSDLF